MFLFKCLSLLIGSDLFTQVTIGQNSVTVSMEYDFIADAVLTQCGLEVISGDEACVCFSKGLTLFMFY